MSTTVRVSEETRRRAAALAKATGRQLQQGHRRPGLVVSSDRLNASRAGIVVVVPLTRTRRDLPSHVEIAPGESGLTQASYAKSEDIKSISTERLVRRLGRVQSVSLDQVGRALALLLELA